MISKLFNLQKNIRDIAATTEDPTYVHTIISELVLRTFTLVIIVIILGTAGFGILGFVTKQPGWWIIFAIGCVISFALLVIRWIIKTIIRRAVNAIYKTVKTHVVDVTPDSSSRLD